MQTNSKQPIHSFCKNCGQHLVGYKNASGLIKTECPLRALRQNVYVLLFMIVKIIFILCLVEIANVNTDLERFRGVRRFVADSF